MIENGEPLFTCLSCGMQYDLTWYNTGNWALPIYCPFCGDNNIEIKEDEASK